MRSAARTRGLIATKLNVMLLAAWLCTSPDLDAMKLDKGSSWIVRYSSVQSLVQEGRAQLS